MQVVHDNFRFTDPPLPEEPTPGQRLFRAWLENGRAGLEAEYDRMYPDTPTPESRE